MGRPKDLPQPVRHHEAHRTAGLQYDDTPGPGHYDTQSICDRESARRVTTIPTAKRIGIYKNEGGPGPVYDVSAAIAQTSGIPSAAPRSFSTARRFVNTEPSAQYDVGPGSYTVSDELTRQRACGGVMLSRYSVAGPGSDHLSPTHYDPIKQAHGRLTAFFGRAGKGGAGGQQMRPMTAGGTMCSLSSMDKAMDLIRPSLTRGISFGGQKRLHQRPSSSIGERKRRQDVDGGGNDIGPGAYDVTQRSVMNAVRPNVHTSTFGRSERKCIISSRVGDRTMDGVPLLYPEQADRTTAPSQRFSSAAVRRGLPLTSDKSNPGPKYDVREKIGDGKVSAYITRAARFRAGGEGSNDAQSDVGPALYNPELPKDMRTTQFGRSERRLHIGDRDASIPGPGTYDTILIANTKEKGKSFTKARWTGPNANSASSGPGPAYNPSDSITRRQIARDITFAKSRRPSGPAATHSKGSTDAMYNPVYCQVDKNTRGAVLYLTG